MIEPTPMTDDQLASIIRGYIDNGRTYASSHYSDDREIARDYYYSRGVALGETCKGESTVISADVPNSVDATLAAMLPAFASTDLLAEFEATSAEDEEAAEEESKIVSHILVDGNAGVIRQAIFDCLLYRNTGIKVSWEDTPETSIESYDNLSVEQIAMAIPQLMGETDDVEPTEIDENEDGTYSATLRRKQERGIPTIQCLPIEEVTVNSSHNDICVEDAKFVSHSPCDVTPSDLKEMGFDPEVVDNIPDYRYTSETTNKRNYGQETTSQDRSTRNLDVHEAFLLVDFDGIGVAQRRRVIMGGTTILYNKEVEAVQIVTGSCWPIPHQWEGVSLFDRLREIQDTKTKLKRQSIDVNTVNLLQRTIANPMRVEMEDLTTGAKRSVVRAKDPRNDVVPFPPIALDVATPSLLMMMNQERSERAGGALDVNIEQMPVNGNMGNHGVERIMTAMETMVSAYVYNFSQTVIRPLYIEIHRQLREHGKDMQLTIDGEYINVDPSKWPKRTKLNVVTGTGLGEQSRKGSAMINILMSQKELMMSGSGMVDDTTVYKALIYNAKYSGIDYPEQFYIDPQSPEAQQAAQQKQQADQQAQQAAEAKEKEMLAFQASLVQMVEQTKQMKIQIDALQKGLDREVEMEKDLNDFTIKATELELVHSEDVPGSAV